MDVRSGRARAGALAALLITSAALAATACGREAPSAAETAPEPVAVGRENLYQVATARLRTGPLVSGTLGAERQATLRAEVAGAVVATPVEEGQAVAQGAVLARIDDAPLRDAAISARSAVRSAEQQVEVARRNAERAEALLRAGAIPERDVETARWSVTSAEAVAADARARETLAQEQLGKTVVRAPFAGIVSHREVTAGDTVAPGSELLTIVDPDRLRLEAAVPADSLPQLALGAPVEFSVAGRPGERFTGTIERINPVADPATRQVEVFVALPNRDRKLVAGLFAEGRIATTEREALAVPLGAIDRGHGQPSALRVAGGKVERVPVELGLEDREAEAVEVVSGLAAGDVVLVGAARGITPGTPVEAAGESDGPPTGVAQRGN